MSLGVFQSNLSPSAKTMETGPLATFRHNESWSPFAFEREQLRGLVRQLFFCSFMQPVRQVVLMALDEDTNVGRICAQVGEALARETKGSVAVIGPDVSPPEKNKEENESTSCSRRTDLGSSPLREAGVRATSNLWFLTEERAKECREDQAERTGPLRQLCDLRREFEYSIVQGPSIALSSDVVALGQLTDGIVLVLTAHKTRRAAARKVKETLEATRTHILGAVLCERTFPLPTVLYRRL